MDSPPRNAATRERYILCVGVYHMSKSKIAYFRAGESGALYTFSHHIPSKFRRRNVFQRSSKFAQRGPDRTKNYNVPMVLIFHDTKPSIHKQR